MLLQGHYIRDMQTATLVTAYLNVHRDAKKSKQIAVEDVAVFRKNKKTEQTPEQQRDILEAITVMMGGEVKHE